MRKRNMCVLWTGLVSVQLMGADFALAQNVSQSELCSLEMRLFAAEASLAGQIRTEGNPIKKDALDQQLSNLKLEHHKARLDFFNAQYARPRADMFMNIRGEKSFTGFTGKLRKFVGSPYITGDYNLEAAVDCPQPRLVLWTNITPRKLLEETMSDLGPLRASLQEMSAGNASELSGTIFVRTNPDSPRVGQTETSYVMKLAGIRKK